MSVEEILSFLSQYPGYGKEGAKRLANKKLKGKASIENCAIALRKFRDSQSSLNTKDFENSKVLIYDIETSYNIVSSWRVGYKVQLPHYSIIKERAVICVSWKWLGEKEVYSLTWDKNQDDKFLIEQFVETLNEADVIVHHNGDNFDLKWLKTRALLHGIEMLPKYNAIDTLVLAKKHFYLNSNKLDYISKFLGFDGKIQTEPELWDKVILHKDVDALVQMVTYCEGDVIQLEKIYNKLKRFDQPKQHAGVLQTNNKNSSPITGTTDITLVKTLTTTAGTVKRIMMDNITKRYFEMSNAKYQKWLDEQHNQLIDE